MGTRLYRSSILGSRWLFGRVRLHCTMESTDCSSFFSVICTYICYIHICPSFCAICMHITMTAIVSEQQTTNMCYDMCFLMFPDTEQARTTPQLHDNYHWSTNAPRTTDYMKTGSAQRLLSRSSAAVCIAYMKVLNGP